MAVAKPLGCGGCVSSLGLPMWGESGCKYSLIVICTQYTPLALW